MGIEKDFDKRPIIIKVDKDLDKYLEMDLFRVKVDKANYVLKTVGLPEFGCNKK